MTAARDCIDIRVRLMKARLSNNMTISDLARIIGASPQAVGQWENCKTMPTLPSVCAWARALGMRVMVEDVK